MRQEHKKLLLKDLSARLPYEVKCYIKFDDGKVFNERTLAPVMIQDFKEHSFVSFIPYLRPLSSMTEEEKELCRSFKKDIMYQGFGDIELYMNRYIEWLDSKRFDWRTNDNGKTLIELGLALEAPEDMYE